MSVELKIIVGGADRSRAALGGLALHALDQTQRQILVTEVVMVETEDMIEVKSSGALPQFVMVTV